MKQGKYLLFTYPNNLITVNTQEPKSSITALQFS